MPAGQVVFDELGPDGCGDAGVVGALLPVCGAVVLGDDFMFVEFGLLELVLAESAMAPFCAAALAGTHVIPGAIGVAFCGVPSGPNTAVVGVVSGFVPGAGVSGVVVAPGPAAFVVMGVGGPIVVVDGVVVVGCAGAAAGAGAVAGVPAGTDV